MMQKNGRRWMMHIQLTNEQYESLISVLGATEGGKGFIPFSQNRKRHSRKGIQAVRLHTVLSHTREARDNYDMVLPCDPSNLCDGIVSKFVLFMGRCYLNYRDSISRDLTNSIIFVGYNGIGANNYDSFIRGQARDKLTTLYIFTPKRCVTFLIPHVLAKRPVFLSRYTDPAYGPVLRDRSVADSVSSPVVFDEVCANIVTSLNAMGMQTFTVDMYPDSITQLIARDDAGGRVVKHWGQISSQDVLPYNMHLNLSF